MQFPRSTCSNERLQAARTYIVQDVAHFFRRRDQSQPYSLHLSWRSYALTTMHRVSPPMDEQARKKHFLLPDALSLQKV